MIPFFITNFLEFASKRKLACRMECLESPDTLLLSCTIAWHRNATTGGPASLADAASECLAGLAALRNPSGPSFPSLQVRA